jgi:hypothetical protein
LISWAECLNPTATPAKNRDVEYTDEFGLWWGSPTLTEQKKPLDKPKQAYRA